MAFARWLTPLPGSPVEIQGADWFICQRPASGACGTDG